MEDDELDPVNVDRLTLRILEQIRDEIRSTRDEIRSTRVELSARIDQTNDRIDQTNARLEVVEHTLVDVASQQRTVVAYLRDHVRADITDLRTRVTALEQGG